jgi:hypothetical protein
MAPNVGGVPTAPGEMGLAKEASELLEAQVQLTEDQVEATDDLIETLKKSNVLLGKLLKSIHELTEAIREDS